MEKQKPKKGLGKGLGALISSTNTSPNIPETIEEVDKTGIMTIDINKIEPNENQPRKHFDEESLEELAESIRNFGIIQPLIVKGEKGFFSIIAGERRWRAARMANLTQVPVIVKEYTEIETIQIALIENIQREDLNPIEEAISYKRLSEEFFLSQEDIANRLGKKRGAITYYLSLLNLDNRVQTLLADGKLTAGHGRSLLAVEDNNEQFVIAENAIEEGFSIRMLDAFIKIHNQNLLNEDTEPSVEVETPDISSLNNQLTVFKKLETDLKDIFGTKVTIKNGKKKGKIEIEYYSEDELDRLIGIMKRGN